MGFTYSPTIDDDRDWVRLSLGDTVRARAIFEDEEIDAILAEEPNKFLAAARLGEIMLASKTKGAVEKAVGDLRIRYSDSPQSAFRAYIANLRKEGAALVQPKPRTFVNLIPDS